MSPNSEQLWVKISCPFSFDACNELHFGDHFTAKSCQTWLFTLSGTLDLSTLINCHILTMEKWSIEIISLRPDKTPWQSFVFFPAHSQLTQLPGRAGWSPSHFGPPGVVEPSLVDGPWMAIIIVSGYSMGQPWVPKKARNPRMFRLTKWTAAQISPNHDIMSYRQIGLSKSRMPENPMVSNLIFTMIHDWYPRTCHGSATGSTKGLPKESWFSSGSTAFIFEPIWYLLGKDLGPLGMLKLAW